MSLVDGGFLGLIPQNQRASHLGPPVVPFLTLFLGEGSPAKIDYRKKGTLILTSLLKDLVIVPCPLRRALARMRNGLQKRELPSSMRSHVSARHTSGISCDSSVRAATHQFRIQSSRGDFPVFRDPSFQHGQWEKDRVLKS